MTQDLSRLEALLGELLELDGDEQRTRLHALQAAADPCVAMVERLLAAHRRGDPRLPTPPEGGLLPVGFDPRWDVADPLLGRTLGDFTLVRCLGAGAMGRVYEARQGSPARRVAVKVLATAFLAGEGALQRFRREADLLGALDHPGICRIHAAGTGIVDGQYLPFIAMECVDGERLDRAADARDPMTAVALLAQVAEAVHYAHERGVVHRDLKPANILVAAAPAANDNAASIGPKALPRTKVLDFGVSLALGQNEATSLRTQTGMVIGTLAYMSPEQFHGLVVDARSDIWALGVVLFELLTGRRPFPGNDAAVLAAQLTGAHEAPRLRRVLPAANRDLEAVIGQALERDPRRRYRSAAEFAADLRAVLARRPVSARRLSTTYRVLRGLRNRRATVLVAVAALAVGVAALLALVHYAHEAATGQRQRQLVAYTAALQEAEAALRAEDVAGARGELRRVPVSQRGYEWRHLAAASVSVEELLRTGRPESGQFPIRLGARHQVAGMRFHLPFHGAWWPHDGRVDFIDLRDLTVVASVRDLDRAPHRAAVTRDGRHAVLAGVSSRSTLQVHDLVRGTTVASRDGFAAEDNCLALQPQGGLAALAGDSGTLRLFALPGLQPRGELRFEGKITGIAFAPDGARLAITHEPAGLSVVELDGGRRLDCDTRGGLPIYPTFADDGVRLAALSHRETNLNLWDSRSGRLLRRQPIPEHPMSLVVIPGTGRLALGAADGSVCLFDFAVDEGDSWTPLLTVRESDQTVHTLAVAPDGTALLGEFGDGTALLWRVPARVELPGETVPR